MGDGFKGVWSLGGAVLRGCYSLGEVLSSGMWSLREVVVLRECALPRTRKVGSMHPSGMLLVHSVIGQNQTQVVEIQMSC